MGLIKDAIDSFRSKDSKEAEWNAYWKQVREENCFRHCRPDRLILDGYYTKLLKAFADMHRLTHKIAWTKTSFGLGLEVSVYVKNNWYHSALDVFEEWQDAYVSSMREYTQDADPATPEFFSKKIVLGLFGEGRYIRSLKGGDCMRLASNGKYEMVPKFEIRDLPRSEDELLLKLDVAGIDSSKSTIQLVRGQD